MATVTLVVHPIDTVAHPTYPAGWRWAVMKDHTTVADMRKCCNAGFANTRADALLFGEAVQAAVILALRSEKIPVEYKTSEMAFDPIPAGVEDLKILTGN